MTLYNVTNGTNPLSNATDIGDLFLYAYRATDGAVFTFFIIAVFFILMMGLSRFEFKDRLVASSFVCFILSCFPAFAGLTNFLYPFIFLILLAGGIILQMLYRTEG
jgi:hypothetical protein